jgi:hypothetical protein
MNVNLEQLVRLRAYELWLRDGMTEGRDSDHWYAAECEILAKNAEPAPVAAPKAKAKRAKAKVKAAA